MQTIKMFFGVFFVQNWSTMASSPLSPDSRISTSAGKLYALQGNKKKCAVYNPKTNQWDDLPKTDRHHGHGALVQKDGRVFVLGMTSAEVYNNDQWERAFDMPEHDMEYPFVFSMDLPQNSNC